MGVGPNEAKPSGHVSLSDGVTTIELIAVGSNLEADPKTIGRSPVDRNPLKTTSGDSTYSDFNYPYSIIAQDNWTGGRGSDRFERDNSKFADSYRAGTDRSGQIVLGGLEKYATMPPTSAVAPPR
jgi:hypothetical protein